MSEILINKRKRNDESSHDDEEKEKCSLGDSMFSNIGNRNKHMHKAHGVDNISSVCLKRSQMYVNTFPKNIMYN